MSYKNILIICVAVIFCVLGMFMENILKITEPAYHGFLGYIFGLTMAWVISADTEPTNKSKEAR